MKTTIKLFLIVSLFVSAGYAEGDMGNGTRTCTGNNCFVGDQTTFDGKSTDISTGSETEKETSILLYVKEYLDSVYRYFEN